ncbi:MAG: D-glycerate dehydrogenase [Simkaniaceae bacterium]|nr:MAG: D-glycerate dehydrogenase [Simkaniaceae bacterium]
MKVYITRKLPDVAEKLLREHFDVDIHPENTVLPSGKLIEVVKTYDGILSTMPDKLNREVLSHAGSLKVIANYAAGLDNIDLDCVKEKGIQVFNLPDDGTNSTADMTWALFLSFIRRIPQGDRFVREGKWGSWDPDLCMGEELAGKTYGVVGYGRIGRAVARRALGFDLNVVIYHRSPKELEDPRMRQLPWDEFLASVDYFSLHTPLTPKTKGLINSETIQRMKKRPLLINMARGSVVKTDDLVEALTNGQLRGAALDVTDPEPLPGDHPLCFLENCLLAPHVGTATIECRENSAKTAAQNLILGLKGKDLFDK